MSELTKIVRFHKPGGPDVLLLEELPIPNRVRGKIVTDGEDLAARVQEITGGVGAWVRRPGGRVDGD